MPDVQISQPVGEAVDSRIELRTLLLAQKTEVIGELTRAIANQFNNTMMGITSYAELELKRLPPTEKRGLEQVLSNAARATGLIQKLLSISRNQPASRENVDLNVIVTGIRSLVEQIIGERISVVYSLELDIPRIYTDPAQLEQVALSLVINARNAMVRGGKLTLTTKLADLTKESLGKGERPGKYVLFSVDDTGSAEPGGSSDTEGSSHIDQDARVNLSLAAISALVKSAEGIVRVSSQPEAGSSFKIYFPPAQARVSAPRSRKAAPTAPAARTILIVEDDDAVRIPTAELLKMEGFKVLQARTGEEAIHVVVQNRCSLDLLITDIVMPKMSGHTVAEKLLEMNPELKVLYMSGEDVSVPHSGVNGANAVLRKPFRLEALKNEIHDLLND